MADYPPICPLSKGVVTDVEAVLIAADWAIVAMGWLLAMLQVGCFAITSLYDKNMTMCYITKM